MTLVIVPDSARPDTMASMSLWEGVLSRIVEAMQERKSSEAVIYLMGRDQMANFQRFDPSIYKSDKKAALEYFNAEFPIDGLKYVAMVFIIGTEGKRVFSEFYPIAPAMEWPDHVSREIIERAVAVLGYGDNTVEGDLISVDARGKH